MSVFRVERNRNYTVMSNYHLRDRRLSLKAKGLLSQMLSLPDDWDYSIMACGLMTGTMTVSNSLPIALWIVVAYARSRFASSSMR